jgi:hypothetical protein
MTDRIVSAFEFDAEAFIDEQEEGEYFTFPLYASSIGRKTVRRALCRRLNMMDRASIGHLPAHLQDDVWQRLRKAARKIQELQEKGATPKNVHEALANNDAMLRVANLFVRYAFVKPQIVLNPDEHDPANGVLHIDWVKPEDRIAFMVACNDATGEEARRFETFRPESADDVPDVQDGEILESKPERSGGDTGHPIQFSAPVHG